MGNAIQNTIKQVQQKYYGKFRGFVVDNQDPEQRARVRVRVPSVFGQQDTFWALPCLPFGGLADQGLFMVPEVGAQVWVEFEEGNQDYPIWTGVFWQPQQPVPDEAQKAEPTTRVLKTPAGHVLQFDDESGAERIRLHHPAGSELNIDEQGTVDLSDPNGSRLTLDAAGNKATLQDGNGNKLVMDASGTKISDANGNEIQMSAGQIKIKGSMITIDGSQVAVGGAGGEPLIKGSSFLALFATHMHTCTAPGSPSSPPIPQGEMSTLTTKTTAS
ncbi:phage baseplate assembly protein V [Marinobacterium rhizophilum]|uniref:Phage tail protein n=1 Tax=Marinobacterium rhizophilum TaxID=420402 RepID=A0ABY5HGT8_9GAMM|nr:phage baseplate assembly protein V [Marinobacterium rhizophilum]UTW11334.1 phage tail protein [Marinobacterium rhizophilum]